MIYIIFINFECLLLFRRFNERAMVCIVYPNHIYSTLIIIICCVLTFWWCFEISIHKRGNLLHRGLRANYFTFINRICYAYLFFYPPFYPIYKPTKTITLSIFQTHQNNHKIIKISNHFDWFSFSTPLLPHQQPTQFYHNVFLLHYYII